jgi:S1-C subfamily serine protease
MRAAVAALALLSFVPQGALLRSGRCEIPQALHQAVRLYPRLGWGAPIAGGRILTARHVISGIDRPSWTLANGTGGGPLEIECEDKDSDLAVLRILGKAPEPMRLASVEPGPQERLWWRALMLNNAAASVRGYYLARDQDRTFAIDGWIHPGASGSPVVNDSGEIVGVLLASVNVIAGDIQPGKDVRGLFRPFARAADPRLGRCAIK